MIRYEGRAAGEGGRQLAPARNVLALQLGR
jgi:hypothetical protein